MKFNGVSVGCMKSIDDLKRMVKLATSAYEDPANCPDPESILMLWEKLTDEFGDVPENDFNSFEFFSKGTFKEYPVAHGHQIIMTLKFGFSPYDEVTRFYDENLEECFLCQDCKTLYPFSEVNYTSVFDDGDINRTQGLVCGLCFRNYVHDEYTGNYVKPGSEDAILIDGVWVHNSIIRLNEEYKIKHGHHIFEYCSSCKKYHFFENVVKTREGYIGNNPECLKGFVECDECGELYRAADGYVTEDGKNICYGCYSNYYITTEDNKVISRRDAIKLEDGRVFEAKDYDLTNAYRCSACGMYFEHQDDAIKIAGLDFCFDCFITLSVCDYHYKLNHNLDEVPRSEISPKFKMADDEDECKEFFGIELETHQFRDNAVWLHHCYRDLISCQNDGSLPHSDSFEMVFEPMSWKFLMEYKDILKKIFETLRNTGASRAPGLSYGTHIHVSRTAFANQEAEDLCEVLVTEFQEEFEVMAQRKGTKYCAYHDKPEGKLSIKKKDYEVLSKDRYTAVNYDNVKTIEFRFFKGIMDLNVLLGDVELIKNLVKIANDIADGRKNEVSFIDDLCAGEYASALLKKVNKKGLITNRTANFSEYFDED